MCPAGALAAPGAVFAPKSPILGCLGPAPSGSSRGQAQGAPPGPGPRQGPAGRGRDPPPGPSRRPRPQPPVPSPAAPLPGFTRCAVSRPPIGCPQAPSFSQPIGAALIGLGPPRHAGSGWAAPPEERAAEGPEEEAPRHRGNRTGSGGLRRRRVRPAPQPRPGAARRLMGVVVPTSARPRPRLPARTTAPGTPRGPPPNRGARCCGGAAAAEAPSQDGGRQ